MKKQTKPQFIKQVLDTLYPDPAIPLKHTSPFTLLVAVLLSAQCTDERVNTITPILFKKADTPEKMIALSIEEIEDIVRPCGLWRKKAKAIFDLSDLLVKKFKGKVPGDLKTLETFPGVGHKTASVVMAQSFKKPMFPVDTHIHRCAKRWGLSCGKNVETTEKDLKVKFPKESWNRLHLQIIYFARAYCQAKCHDISQCPICSQIDSYSF